MIHAGVIRNLKSHRNRAGAIADLPPGVLEVVAGEPDELYDTLEWFARSGVELVVIDGGDGTIRDVLSRVTRAYGEKLPRFAVLPSGKTNALALDLGVPLGTPVEAVLKAAQSGGRTKVRACLEVVRQGQTEPEFRGYLFGLGAFVRGTELAQKTHGLGFFDNAAIGLTIASAALRTLSGRRDDRWRRGERAALAQAGRPWEDHEWFLVMASTLKRFPLGLRPFGEPHEGLKVLTVDAPPKQLARAATAILRGSTEPWLERAGYRHHDIPELRIACGGDFVLDGEIYPGGELTVRQGPELEFLLP